MAKWDRRRIYSRLRIEWYIETLSYPAERRIAIRVIACSHAQRHKKVSKFVRSILSRKQYTPGWAARKVNVIGAQKRTRWFNASKNVGVPSGR